MKALVLNGIGRGFDYEDVDIAEPIGREVLVGVASGAVIALYILSHDLAQRVTGVKSVDNQIKIVRGS